LKIKQGKTVDVGHQSVTIGGVKTEKILRNHDMSARDGFPQMSRSENSQFELRAEKPGLGLARFTHC